MSKATTAERALNRKGGTMSRLIKTLFGFFGTKPGRRRAQPGKHHIECLMGCPFNRENSGFALLPVFRSIPAEEPVLFGHVGHDTPLGFGLTAALLVA